MTLSEKLMAALKERRDAQAAKNIKKTVDYVKRLKPLEVPDDTTVRDLNSGGDTGDKFRENLIARKLSKGDRIGVSHLLNPLEFAPGVTSGYYEITVGEVREMSDQELRLLGASDKGVKVARKLFGRQRV